MIDKLDAQIESMEALELLELYADYDRKIVTGKSTQEDREIYHLIVNELLGRMIPVKELRKEV